MASSPNTSDPVQGRVAPVRLVGRLRQADDREHGLHRRGEEDD